MLEKKRTKFFETQYESNKQNVKIASGYHKKSEDFLANILDGNIAQIKQYLLWVNQGVESI